jgi:leucyl-tRNA synthetase
VDKTVLAEEQVDSNLRSWRSGAKVEKKLLHQWFIRTAVFAERLSQGLKSGDLKQGWRDVVALQDHWIGEIKGYFTDCIVDLKESIRIDQDIKQRVGGSTTKEPLRLWFSNLEALKKAKFVILSPNHFLVQDANSIITEKDYPDGYKLMKLTINNPLTGEQMPVFTGPSDKMPWIPESCDCRIGESLQAADYSNYIESDEGEEFLVNISNLYKLLPVQNIHL